MYKELYAHDMIRYLPNSGVSCLLPATIIHLLDIKSTDANIRQASIRKFQFCIQALQRLREMYASADFAFSFLDAAIRKTNAQIGATTLIDNVEVKLSLSLSSMDLKNGSSGPLLLTPPPEAMQTASMLLGNSTLARDERTLLAAYAPDTPPGSNKSLKSHTTGGAAVALTDLLDEHNHQTFDFVEESNQGEFDALVNLEGEHDLFSTTENDLDLSVPWLEYFDLEEHK
jgi:hypothetical protein